ncbi:MAG TPA: peptidase M23 [Holosporales bacterium]|nr:peptidase M23 [Holosporales bacterium]
MSPLQSIMQRSTLRLLGGAFLIIIACTIALWDYTTQQIEQWQLTTQQDEDCKPCEGEESQASAVETPEFIDETLDVKRGDNFTSVLYRAEISKDQTLSLIKALKTIFSPRDLRTDHKLFITYRPPSEKSATKDLTRLVIKLSLEKDVVVEQDEAGLYQARLETKELIHEYRHAEGKIESSLYVDAIKQGAHPKIIHNMIQAFSYDVDFQRSFQAGDDYCLLFDFHKNAESLEEEPGDLIYACLTLQGKKIHIYRHTPKGSVAQYFNEKGEAVKKGLLRTPVDGARISGVFGKRRHPVLGFTKMHKGIDFAAPRGTPVMAAGSGKIVRIGRFSTYGNYIRVRHNSKYSTAYAHLCRYAKGLKVGSSVRQGQVIGYVGCTGRATGNHLHYELLANGKQINPKHIKMMPAAKLKGAELQRFMANKELVEKRLQNLRDPLTEAPEILAKKILRLANPLKR